MAEPTTLVSSAFPPPPPFFKHFTPENLAELEDHQKLGTPNDQLPIELQYLIPPLPPGSSYRCFGDMWQIPDVLPTLPQMGITQLYNDPPQPPLSEPSSSTTTTQHPPSNNRAISLLRLSKSLLLNYFELLSLLSFNPTITPSKLQDLRTIMINMHHLINEYRPHQARETLIMLMEEQIEKCRKEKEENLRAKETVGKVLGVLEGMLEGGLGVPGMGVGEGEGEAGEGERNGKVGDQERVEWERRERDLEMWRVLDGLSISQAS